jgi:predicted KAP-like P-loop ATPase
MLELMKLADGLAPLLSTADVVKGNPRLMKRFLNTVFLRKSLAEPQGIVLDLEALAKWHLIERCAPKLSAQLANLVTSASDGRVSILHAAEVAAAKGEGLLPSFGDGDPFVTQWLQLKPLLGEADLRPILHLSRDTDTRDFGADELTQAGRQLRDALVAATSKNNFLTEAIQDAGPQQAGLAMKRAWQLQANKRTWRASVDVLMLVETCRIFPQHGVLAAELLSKAPLASVGGGLIPDLVNQAWAVELLKEWTDHPDVEAPVKRAIKALAKVSK